MPSMQSIIRIKINIEIVQRYFRLYLLLLLLIFAKSTALTESRMINGHFIFLSVKRAVEIINTGAMHDNLRKLCMHIIIEILISL